LKGAKTMSDLQAVHMFPGLEPLFPYKVIVFFNRVKFTLKKSEVIYDNMARAVAEPYNASISFPEGPLHLEINAIGQNEIGDIAKIAVDAIAKTQKVSHYFIIRENEWVEKRNSLHQLV
jgi:hypothetical protein